MMDNEEILLGTLIAQPSLCAAAQKTNLSFSSRIRERVFEAICLSFQRFGKADVTAIALRVWGSQVAARNTGIVWLVKCSRAAKPDELSELLNLCKAGAKAPVKVTVTSAPDGAPPDLSEAEPKYSIDTGAPEVEDAPPPKPKPKRRRRKKKADEE